MRFDYLKSLSDAGSIHLPPLRQRKASLDAVDDVKIVFGIFMSDCRDEWDCFSAVFLGKS